MSKPPATSSASPAFELPRVAKAGLRELHPGDDALLLMHFAYRGLVMKADACLAEQGLSRVHRRILYVVARADGIAMGQLIELLGASKQSLQRALAFLQDEGYIVAQRDPQQYRSKQLRLTVRGARIEEQASSREREAMEAALAAVPPDEQEAWRKIMTALARLV